MRTVTAMLSFLVATLALGWWSSHTLETSADKLYQEAKSIQRDLNQAQWSSAHSSVKELDKIWNTTRSQWMILVDHRELDSIETSLARLDSFITSQDLTLTKSELANLLLLIKHIPDKEAVNLRNIF